MSHATVSHGNLARTGQCPGPGVTAEPKVFRRYTTGAEQEPSPPTVADGVLYVGDADGNVHAFDVETGEQLWHHCHVDEQYPTAIDKPPVVASDLVIVEASEQVYGHARDGGQVRWRIGGICPTVAGDLLMVFDELDDGIRAFDAASGQPRWHTRGRRFDGRTYGLLQAHPTIADGLMLVAEGYEGHHTHGGLHAFDQRTGTLRWGIAEDEAACTLPVPCGEPDGLELAPYHPVLAHDLVWAVRARLHENSTTLELTGFDPETVEPRWVLADEEWLDTEAHEHLDGAPVLGPQFAYCRSGNRVDALDLATRAVRWTRRLAAPIVGTPLLAGDTLHLATEGGGLHALHATTGAPVWDFTVDEPTAWSEGFAGEYDETNTPFTLAAGTLYARTDSAVLALR